MKRSEINRVIREAVKFFDEMNFKLPPFAFFTPEEWKNHKGDAQEIFDLQLGWDVTSFNHDNFHEFGLLLFTLRNGLAASRLYPKPYAEKIMIIREKQITPLHFHWHKQEDIINRGGGNLLIELFRSNPSENCLAGGSFDISVNGMKRSMNSGDTLILTPGESVSLESIHAHRFYAEKGHGTVLAGEVSMVNDDNTDNCFIEKLDRFDRIKEDEKPEFLLASEYRNYL